MKSEVDVRAMLSAIEAATSLLREDAAYVEKLKPISETLKWVLGESSEMDWLAAILTHRCAVRRKANSTIAALPDEEH